MQFVKYFGDVLSIMIRKVLASPTGTINTFSSVELQGLDMVSARQLLSQL